MIGFFPVPYPDEILYSTIARYHLRTTNRSVSPTAREIFGRDTSKFSIDFPNSLKHLNKQLPPGHNLNVDRLIDNHTLFPFYSPFIPPKRVKNLRQDMANRSKGSAHGRSGTLTSNIENKHLRFCPICVNEDINLYGETFWHRSHQLPGIFVCLHHFVFLENGIEISSHRKECLSVAKKTIQNVPPRFLDLNNKNHRIHLFLAEQAFFLLQQKGLDFCGPDFFRRRFQKILMTKGLADINRRVHIEKVCELFEQTYEPEFLSQMACTLENKNNWIKRLLQASLFFQHPIRNFLLLHFLDYKIEDFLKLEDLYPFGTPPFPCLNPHSDHYREFMISECKVSRRGENIRGTFSCSCGFTYRRSGWDEQKSRIYEYDKIISYGESYEKKMSTDKIQEIAQKYEERKSTHRSKWSKILKANPNLGRSKLRLINQHTYKWLIDNDRDWFEKNTLKKIKVFPKMNLEKWKLRDLDWAEKAEKLAIEIFSSNEKPVWVSKTYLSRNLRIAHIVFKRPNCLPNTLQTILKYAESNEDFIARRIRFFASCFIKENIFAGYWKLVMRARVMKIHLLQNPKIKEAIMESLTRIKNAYDNSWKESS